MTDRQINGLENVPASLRGCVVTIGNFDGVHLGHRRLISKARELAHAAGVPAVAITFNLPPDQIIRPADAPQRVSPHAEKIELLLDAGCDYVVTAKTDLALLSMEADDFIDHVVVTRFAPSHVVEGPNFFFGHNRSGNIETLKAAGLRDGFGVHVVEALKIELPEGLTRVSSTLIRRLITEGRVETASELLTRPFALTGEVVHGEQVGRLLEYPTANIAPAGQIVPADGVYAGRVTLEGQQYATALSVGHKPTLGDYPLTVEANLLDASGDFYGRMMTVTFERRFRGQVKYPSLDELKAQIAKDVQHTRECIKLEQ